MDFLKYITANALILIPVLYIIGMILKSTPKIPNWLIPYILLPLGVLGTIGLTGFNIDAVIQGILITGAAVYTNQLIKQATCSRCSTDDKTDASNTGNNTGTST